MIYTNNYFGKSKITDITYQDIINFFSIEREESDKIEFKSFVSDGEELQKQKDKEKGIIRAISGFLNSEGGLLIWGAPTGKKIEGKKEKVFIGEPSLVKYKYEKDQIISKITDSITPTPKGILFHRIEHQNEYIYIFEIPKSIYGPHQYDERFYMRIDGQTKPAPYHYIEALFKQIKFPNLKAYLKIDGWNFNNEKGYLEISIYIFNLSKLQNDYNLSYRMICDIGKFQGWENSSFSPGLYSMNGREKIIRNTMDIIHYGESLHQSHTIEFESRYLYEKQGRINLNILFGAKYSPMKQCSYLIEVSQTLPKNFNEWLIDIKENELMGDVSDIDDDKKVKDLIGRK